MVCFSPAFFFSLSVQGRGGVLRSQVQWGKELPGSFGVIREIRRHPERPRPEPTECFGAARESGLLDTSRPAQPVEQVDRSEPECERRGLACGGCTHAETDRCHGRVPSPAPHPPPALDAHSPSAFAVRLCEARP